MRRIKIALFTVAVALAASLIGNIYLGASYATQQFEAGYQAGYEAAQEEAKTTREPSQSGTVQSYTYVYVTRSGEKYHTETCHYAENAEAITLGEAIEKGYEPCSVCNPPRG